ncbi:MAG: hypothetical protein NUW22_12420 [Acidobacteria bacterium]|nr:hypothetical protein [Acidobacteriota bacterium]
MAYEKDPAELGALWVRVSQSGARYMTGTISGVDVVCFENKNKQGKQPDWRVKKSEPRDGQSAGTRKLDTREDERRPSRVDDADSDGIPF